MVRCLSTLTRLDELSLRFKSPLSRPVRESRRPHPLTRSALPALTDFWFEGASEYLEDLIARIDVPLIDRLKIRFFHQLIFDTPQLVQFVARTPNIHPPVEAYIDFNDDYVQVTSPRTIPGKFQLGINCIQSDWQLSCLTQVCSSSFPEAFISTVEHLYIRDFQACWQDDIEDSQWLECLSSIHCCEMSLPIPGIRITYRSRPARARRGNITLPSESFLGGSPPIRACRRSHRKVRCRATARRSPYSYFPLGRKRR
jgi:hypothetical protein